MLYANVVLGLPVEGPFDYIVPADLENKISVGSRVKVNFRNKKETAYVVALDNKTKIRKLKEIIELIDRAPILDGPMLELTQKLSDYYCCSWGEAIEAAIPAELRKGKEIGLAPLGLALPRTCALGRFVASPGSDVKFVQGQDRIPFYLKEIRAVLAAGQSTIFLLNDLVAVEKVKTEISKDLNIEPFVSFRNQPDELKIWQKIKQAQNCAVVGMRSSIFAPVNNLGLVIVDQEGDQVYKQEQTPHYHAREVALMRAEISGAKVILGNHSLSLESFYLAKTEDTNFEVIPPKLTYPQIKIIDVRRLAYADRKNKLLFSKFLSDAIYSELAIQGKVLLVINRTGFATVAACHNCGVALKCPRCNINLVFHFEEDQLKCHHCNFKMAVPKICPDCNAGYIKYSGIGTEKVESELSRIFPQARIKIIDDEKQPIDFGNTDIFISTGAIIKRSQILNFDLVGVLAIDNLLNRVDFRAAEKTFSLLIGLTGLTGKKMIIQSAYANHHCFQALAKNDPQFFYKTELKQRKQLNLAPFKHVILLKVRGENLGKVKKASLELFEKLSQAKTSGLKVLALNPGQPEKLRGNFYYQILMRASCPQKVSKFLKLHLKDWHYSGIIVTVDVDPI